MKYALTFLAILSFSPGLFYSHAVGQTADSKEDQVEKVKTAMLCKQRYSWEHGTAMQGMMAIGDTSSLIIMAREALQRMSPDGRLSMVGSDMNIADPGVNGPPVLFAYQLTREESFQQAARLGCIRPRPYSRIF